MAKETSMFHGGLELMVWGMICCDGPIEIVEITGRLKSSDYIAIL